jgi:hypothetical protein
MEKYAHMKILTSQVLKDYEGKDISETVTKDGKIVENPVTLRAVISTSLNTLFQNEPQTAEEKSKIFQLSLKLYAGKEPDFTVDDLAFIKTKVGKVYNALVYGRVCEVFEKDTAKTPAAH